MTKEEILKDIWVDEKEGRKKRIPQNDIPIMADLIVRKIKIREHIYADMILIYTYLPIGVKKKIHTWRKRIREKRGIK